MYVCLCCQGDDYVIMCIKDGDTASAISSFNEGYSNGEFDDVSMTL